MSKNKLDVTPKFITEDILLNKIYEFRGQKIMLDSDLAELYGVETKRLNEQVRRNLTRFPEDFMFTLDKDEVEILKSQIATSSWGGRRNTPNVFSEHGVLMLSSVTIITLIYENSSTLLNVGSFFPGAERYNEVMYDYLKQKNGSEWQDEYGRKAGSIRRAAKPVAY
ncbi:ORF6N domain-containing protein [Sphingobacterium alkalisoli]|uniref:ORF6N domain-containing protein n=1 Tax=Sphingobacterium alkalisoli TaxID=1874115 RepID=A0A4V5LYC3_9SPHI|nr:ORF6N domain-containing protein [Sphingobacterium alkalisoli]TJY65839.1 ORF6N domain-containing protein [Sphingobacterium alkalisoli]GGH17980.1 hypothetical protein GCM10011418_21340 [Sphingobacterium alkalisoli]